MKTLITLVLSMIIFIPAFAQDVIVHKDGTLVMGKVKEITQESIRYQKADNPEGPVYSVPLSDILSIRYENGKTEKVSDMNFRKEAVSNRNEEENEERNEEKDAVKNEKEDKEEIEENDSDNGYKLFHPELRVRYEESFTKGTRGGGDVEFVAAFQFSPQFIIGPGVGINAYQYCKDYERTNIPIFVQSRYRFTDKRISPYFAAQIGYTFSEKDYDENEWDGTDDDFENVGFFGLASIGCGMRLRHGELCFDLGVRYQQTSVSKLKDSTFAGASICYSWGR